MAGLQASLAKLQDGHSAALSSAHRAQAQLELDGQQSAAGHAAELLQLRGDHDAALSASQEAQSQLQARLASLQAGADQAQQLAAQHRTEASQARAAVGALQQQLAQVQQDSSQQAAQLQSCEASLADSSTALGGCQAGLKRTTADGRQLGARVADLRQQLSSSLASRQAEQEQAAADRQSAAGHKSRTEVGRALAMAPAHPLCTLGRLKHLGTYCGLRQGHTLTATARAVPPRPGGCVPQRLRCLACVQEQTDALRQQLAAHERGAAASLAEHTQLRQQLQATQQEAEHGRTCLQLQAEQHAQRAGEVAKLELQVARLHESREDCAPP